MTPAISALCCDVFGTVVDWRGSVIAEGQALAARMASPDWLAVDWPAFADAWRAGYAPAMDQVRRRELPWTPLDGLHRRILVSLLAERGLVLPEPELTEFNRAWHRLQPWPDSVPGLQRLKARFTITPLSNGNLSLLVDMAKQAGLPWDAVLSAELFGHYKPDPEVYQGATRLLGLPPAEVLMVAAHPSDLRAAKACGLRTAYVPRPLERGPGAPLEPARDGEFDFVASDFIALAQQLGA